MDLFNFKVGDTIKFRNNMTAKFIIEERNMGKLLTKEKISLEKYDLKYLKRYITKNRKNDGPFIEVLIYDANYMSPQSKPIFLCKKLINQPGRWKY